MRALRALLAGAALLSSVPARAFPIRVSTATELLIEPEVSADHERLDLSLQLRDDQRAGVAGAQLSVDVEAPPGFRARYPARTDQHGHAVVSVPLSDEAVTVVVNASYEPSERLAGARAHADIDLRSPYVTVELSDAPATLSLTAPPSDLHARVDPGHVRGLVLRDLPVGLSVSDGRDDRIVAVGMCDASGVASLTLGRDAFRRAGVYQLRPRVEVVGGHPILGTARPVLVRVDTSLVAVLVSEPDDLHARVRGRLRTARDEPVPGAPVRLMHGDETVAAARTDVAGEFVFEVDLERASLAGALMRARFDPAEPWFAASESASFRVGEAPAGPIPWGWTVVPWVALALAGLAFALRRRPAPTPAAPVPVDERLDVVVRTAETVDGSAEFVVEPFDRSTGTPLTTATWRASDHDGAALPTSAVRPLTRGARVTIEVSLDGYEPRRVEVSRLSPGRHRVRVGMMGWREALFDRARPALVAARAESATMPTPREAGGGPWVELLEAGAYGPTAPDEGAVRSVERALSSPRVSDDGTSDAVDAVN